MRGFLSLDFDAASIDQLIALQGRLRDALTRQGVHFAEPDRFGPTLIAWPFATLDELETAAEQIRDFQINAFRVADLRGGPNDDRPAEVGFVIEGLEATQALLAERLRTTLDPDPPKAMSIRLARVAPPSRKVGACLRGSGILGTPAPSLITRSLTIWRQTAQGFEPCRTMPLVHGGS